MKVEDIVLRLVLAAIIGGLIGLERKMRHKPAGITTHLVVCLGAALLSVVQKSIDLDMIMNARANPEIYQVFKVDTGRIPAQIVSGIGFLGAGVIMQSKKSITGITSAATIWITACIGIALGLGYVKISLIASGILLFCVLILKTTILTKFLGDEVEEAEDTEEVILEKLSKNNRNKKNNIKK